MDDFEQSQRIRIIAAGKIAIFPPSTRAVLVFSIAHDLASLGRTLRERVRLALRGLSKLPSPRRMAAVSQAIPPFSTRQLLSLSPPSRTGSRGRGIPVRPPFPRHAGMQVRNAKPLARLSKSSNGRPFSERTNKHPHVRLLPGLPLSKCPDNLLQAGT